MLSQKGSCFTTTGRAGADPDLKAQFTELISHTPSSAPLAAYVNFSHAATLNLQQV